MARVPTIHHRILSSDCGPQEFTVEPAINLSDDTVFEFLGEKFDSVRCDPELENSSEEDECCQEAESDDFWERQSQHLQSTICRTTSLESQIRKITNHVLDGETGNGCGCTEHFSSACRKCLMEDVCRNLRNAGFDSAICTSKWRSSPDIPSGQHTFLDVVDNSNPKKGQVRVVIEFNFRAEFEMARANQHYKELINQLPETFVGKIERLLGVLKIMSSATKKCMKEKKMHMGPWRKHSYMQAKWLRTSDNNRSPPPPPHSARLPRPMRSMLTLDLNESGLHRPVVRVV
ncbi:hypothetical protein M569_04251 [Genlisea aurea]|uniref:Uncharacterized protein n=1 Tax=Genlisea aurea TaxID=192259 RepID=S8ED97_9LAMI|nr:hypothetical protein M569_04251 [Genlisea aurea]